MRVGATTEKGRHGLSSCVVPLFARGDLLTAIAHSLNVRPPRLLPACNVIATAAHDARRVGVSLGDIEGSCTDGSRHDPRRTNGVGGAGATTDARDARRVRASTRDRQRGTSESERGRAATSPVVASSIAWVSVAQVGTYGPIAPSWERLKCFREGLGSGGSFAISTSCAKGAHGAIGE